MPSFCTRCATLEQSEHEMEEADTDASDVDSSERHRRVERRRDRAGIRRKSMPERWGMRADCQTNPISPFSLGVHRGVRTEVTKLDNAIAARDAVAQLIADLSAAAKNRGTSIFLNKFGIQPRWQCC